MSAAIVEDIDNAMMTSGIITGGYDLLPDGFEWGNTSKLILKMIFLAIFNWDAERSSKKLTVEDDSLTIKVKDGSGFKTSIGD